MFTRFLSRGSLDVARDDIFCWQQVCFAITELDNKKVSHGIALSLHQEKAQKVVDSGDSWRQCEGVTCRGHTTFSQCITTLANHEPASGFVP